MPYNPMMPNPNTNPDTETKAYAYKSLDDALDHIYTYLMEGQIWHERMANQCRKICIRGWGRWHEAEALGDICCSMKLNKIIMDKLWYTPKLDVTKLDKPSKDTLSGIKDLNTHHKVWIEREEKLIHCLNYAIHEAREKDIELYKKLMCLQEEVQNEKMRVELIMGRLSLKPDDGHDIGVISKCLHEYFEHEYKQGEPIDFNVG